MLERLRPYHPIIGDILEYRQVMKLKSTYADGLWKAADSAGRVHTSFHQTITATGRLSSTEPKDVYKRQVITKSRLSPCRLRRRIPLALHNGALPLP